MQDAINFFNDHQKQTGPSRNRLLLCYLKDIKYKGYYSYYGYCDYAKDVACRAIRMWGLDNGVYNLTLGDQLPAGEVNRLHGYDLIDTGPIGGTVISVISQLVAIKNGICSPATIRAIDRRPFRFESNDIKLRGCVYYMGRLHITDDKEKYKSICDVAEVPYRSPLH